MSEILSSVLTPPILVILIITAIIMIGLWIVCIVWVNRDAKTREASVGLWTVIAIVPVAGLVAYCLMRPPLNAADSTEQVMILELMGRQLADYGNCPRCGEPVKSDYIVCPKCRAQLLHVFSNCRKPLEPGWQICPYCGRPFARQRRQRSA